MPRRNPTLVVCTALLYVSMASATALLPEQSTLTVPQGAELIAAHEVTAKTLTPLGKICYSLEPPNRLSGWGTRQRSTGASCYAVQQEGWQIAGCPIGYAASQMCAATAGTMCPDPVSGNFKPGFISWLKCDVEVALLDGSYHEARYFEGPDDDNAHYSRPGFSGTYYGPIVRGGVNYPGYDSAPGSWSRIISPVLENFYGCPNNYVITGYCNGVTGGGCTWNGANPSKFDTPINVANYRGTLHYRAIYICSALNTSRVSFAETLPAPSSLYGISQYGMTYLNYLGLPSSFTSACPTPQWGITNEPSNNTAGWATFPCGSNSALVYVCGTSWGNSAQCSCNGNNGGTGWVSSAACAGLTYHGASQHPKGILMDWTVIARGVSQYSVSTSFAMGDSNGGSSGHTAAATITAGFSVSNSVEASAEPLGIGAKDTTTVTASTSVSATLSQTVSTNYAKTSSGTTGFDCGSKDCSEGSLWQFQISEWIPGMNPTQAVMNDCTFACTPSDYYKPRCPPSACCLAFGWNCRVCMFDWTESQDIDPKYIAGPACKSPAMGGIADPDGILQK